MYTTQKTIFSKKFYFFPSQFDEKFRETFEFLQKTNDDDDNDAEKVSAEKNDDDDVID